MSKKHVQSQSDIMAEPLKLEDILPEHPEFTLQSTGKTYRLRLLDAYDHVWMRQFGDSESITAIFQTRSWDQIGKIVYRLLENKSDFLAITRDEIDDAGEKVSRKYTGPEMLLKSIRGMEEETQVLGALTKAFALSNPLVDQYIREEILKKNHLEPSPVGEKSLT